MNNRRVARGHGLSLVVNEVGGSLHVTGGDRPSFLWTYERCRQKGIILEYMLVAAGMLIFVHMWRGSYRHDMAMLHLQQQNIMLMTCI